MDGHLFRDIIVTEGARLMYCNTPDETGIFTEYYEGKNLQKVPIIVDPEDDEIDGLTGTVLLHMLGMGEISSLLFPKSGKPDDDEVSQTDNTDSPEE
jgi:hypothetical protein